MSATHAAVTKLLLYKRSTTSDQSDPRMQQYNIITALHSKPVKMINNNWNRR